MKLYGKNPVIERLKSDPGSIRKIFIQERHRDGAYIQKKARKKGIPVYSVPRTKMVKLARNVNAQGLLAEIEDYAYADFGELLDTAVKKGHPLLFLDNLNDPQNLGVIMRSAACLGGFALVIPQHESVCVTEAVLRIASGAENFLQVARVTNLGQAVDKARTAGYWIAGTAVEGGQDIRETDLPFPLALIIGSEHKGVRPGLKKKIDLALTLPMAHARLAFNAAQAATVFCYEINRQKKRKEKKAR